MHPPFFDMIFPKPHSVRQRGAFSLIEVVIAVAIIAFCLVGMVGLLSVGLDLSRVNAAITSNTMLFEKVVNQLRVSALDSQTPQPGEANTDLYSLPQLDTAGGETTFTVDSVGRFLTDGASTAGDANKVINVKILDPSDLQMKNMDSPSTLSGGGKIAFIWVKIKSARGYDAKADRAISTPSTFCTEISLLSQ